MRDFYFLTLPSNFLLFQIIATIFVPYLNRDGI